MSDLPSRKRLSDAHPVVGAGYLLLDDSNMLREGDETACVSLLLSLEHFEPWYPVDPEYYGETVAEWLEHDMDASERVFRRKIGE